MSDSAASSMWSLLPRNIIWRLLESFPLYNQSKPVKSNVKLVNKHWCDAVRAYALKLDVRKTVPFFPSCDLKNLCEKFKNLEVVVIEDGNADDATKVDVGKAAQLNWLTKVKLSNTGFQTASCIINHAPHLTHISLDAPRFPLTALWDIWIDGRSLQWLQLTGNIDIPSETPSPWNLPELETLDISGVVLLPDMLPLLIEGSPLLQSLRLNVRHLSRADFETLHGMKQLTSLVLDGLLEDDLFDPACLPSLERLGIACRSLPRTLSKLSRLTCLELETRDALKDRNTLGNLYDVVAKLDRLELNLPGASKGTISDILSYGTKLTSLKIKNHILVSEDAHWMKHLTDLNLTINVNLKKYDRRTLLRSIARLQKLTSLKICLNNPIDIQCLVRERKNFASNFRHLTIHGFDDCDLYFINQSGVWIQDLRISNWTFNGQCFVCTNNLRSLTNLCFSKCRWKTNLENELKTFLKWKHLSRLKHLALPTECFHPKYAHLIDELKQQQPHLIIDDRADWPIDHFQL